MAALTPNFTRLHAASRPGGRRSIAVAASPNDAPSPVSRRDAMAAGLAAGLAALVTTPLRYEKGWRRDANCATSVQNDLFTRARIG